MSEKNTWAPDVPVIHSYGSYEPKNNAPSGSDSATSSSSFSSSSNNSTGTGKGPSGISADDIIGKANTLIMSMSTSSPNEVKKLVLDINKLVEDASAHTDESDKRDVSNLRIKEYSQRMDVLAASLGMMAGIEGSAAQLSAANEQLYTTRFLVEELKNNPGRYYARKKSELYASLAGYIGQAGQALSNADLAKGQFLNGIANLFGVQASVLSAQAQGAQAAAQFVQAKAQTTQANAQSESVKNANDPLALLGNFVALMSQGGIPGNVAVDFFARNNPGAFSKEGWDLINAARNNMISGK